ncbi:MAG TPA: CoA transferase [Alphaproteobacteria bacterium]|jgi:crotonobetainyl-CoA:carnitine CoA-transferase CaiB-like acyl-CoA transferase|nr:CoA transferase [Alphaproteobacteria bacterium]
MSVLEGIRVLDFGRYIAGPCCATLLGDFGAEVIRVEKVDGSEDRFTSPITSDGEGCLFLQLGRNKKGLTLNPMKPEGKEILARLVATADVVLANLPFETLEAMGLDYASLKAIKDDIISVTPSAFGSTGPYAAKVGFDGIGQAMAGNMHLSGPADQPTKSWAPYVDFTTAILMAFGTMVALRERDKTGQGQQVEGSLLGSALWVGNAFLMEQAALALDRVGSLNRSQGGGPADTFATMDGWVLVHVTGRPLFERWARLMGEEHWLEDPRFEGDQDRGDNGQLLSERMAPWCAERSTAEVLTALEKARIPGAPILNPQQALDDPHVNAVGYLQDIDYPGLERPARVADTPVKLSATPGAILRRAPTLGEHTDDVLEALGYSAAEIGELREKRVV